MAKHADAFRVEGNATVTGDLDVDGTITGAVDLTGALTGAVTGDVTGDVTGLVNGVDFDAVTVADTGEVLAVASVNQVSTVTPNETDADEGTYSLTIDGEPVVIVFDDTAAEAKAAIELAIPALTDLTSIVGTIATTVAITFLDARPHTVVAADIDLDGAGAPYTFETVTDPAAVPEHVGPTPGLALLFSAAPVSVDIAGSATLADDLAAALATLGLIEQSA